MYGMQMAADRTANPPGDDLVTKLVQADVDGHKLSDDEFGFFVILLAVAGNETTRNSITHGMTAFADFPDQWELYKAQRPVTAVDEIVRWATPVTSFQRTALEDVELSGVQIKKGQRVVMSYRSANFDEEVFDDPFTFNILRDPNPPHVGFGGHRRALLPRRQPGEDDHRSDVQCDRRSHAGSDPPAVQAGAVAVRLAQRHQALAGRLHRSQRGQVACGTARYSRGVTETAWTLTAAEGELQILTGVGGPAAKMGGHRLTIAFASWQAEVQWRGDEPATARLVVDVDSLQVLKGEGGGVTPLTGPEKGVVRSNALKSLDAKKFPTITFVAEDISAIPTGYRLDGTVEIHGTSRPHSVDLAVEDAGDTWVMTTSTAVVQSQFGVKPYSLFMGTLKVDDEVTLRFTARHAK